MGLYAQKISLEFDKSFQNYANTDNKIEVYNMAASSTFLRGIKVTVVKVKKIIFGRSQIFLPDS